MTIALPGRGLAKTIHAVECYSGAGVELWRDPHGGIDLSSDRMRQPFHAVRLIRPGYFRLSLEACQFSICCVLRDKDVRLNGYLCQIRDEFPPRPPRSAGSASPD